MLPRPSAADDHTIGHHRVRLSVFYCLCDSRAHEPIVKPYRPLQLRKQGALLHRPFIKHFVFILGRWSLSTQGHVVVNGCLRVLLCFSSRLCSIGDATSLAPDPIREAALSHWPLRGLLWVFLEVNGHRSLPLSNWIR